MTNLLTILAFGGETGMCAWCHASVVLEMLIDFPVEIDEETGMESKTELVCDECMAPIREERARELALCDGSSDDPLDSAQSIEEQRSAPQEKRQFLARHPEFGFPDGDTDVGPILACNIPLQEVIRQVRLSLECVTEPGSERNPANARAEKAYRAFLLAVEA